MDFGEEEKSEFVPHENHATSQAQKNIFAKTFVAKKSVASNNFSYVCSVIRY